jgi:hypothetical protein
MEASMVQMIGIGVTLLITGANAAFFVVIKFNDIFHLGKKVDELSKNINDLVKMVEHNDKDISVIKAVCKERHQV